MKSTQQELGNMPDDLIAWLTRNGYKLSNHGIYFQGNPTEGMRDMIGVFAIHHIADFIQSREAELESKHSREIVEAKTKALERVLISTGRWTDESDLGLIELSSDPYDRLIAEQAIEYHEELERLQPQSSKEET